MDTITRALQRAKESTPVPGFRGSLAHDFALRREKKPRPANDSQTNLGNPDVTKLDEDLLSRNRVVAFEPNATPTRYYDILRNQLTQHQHKSGRHIVAVCGPTRGCGATAMAVNLAFSFSRIRAQRVILLDANTQNPAVRRYLGLPEQGLLESSFLTSVQVRDVPLQVMTLANAEQEGREALLNLLRGGFEDEATVLVVDLSPLLTSDNGMSYLRLADSFVVVLAEGLTTLADVEFCKRFIGSRDGVQFVLNKGGRHGL
ncbi:hypothetical protein LHFGNBLO_001651 [Mesorhizobium sp. AR10]|uniref:hypothetical protein n=1 Tax=Mesorhizobium sp. AR10 TaxID=2865839 RepID=UPI00215DDB04|nr:hypothetical protein [Mesorhizobium sp. AR10]UVK40212.1 hypothetical protein LHFGNBLO_001651 [Mesorhizobium sp. AR10]